MTTQKPRVSRGEGKVMELLYSLCSLHADDAGQIATLYRHAITILESDITAPTGLDDEFRLSERIQKKFVQEQREADAVTFLELHQRLLGQKVLKRCGSVLLFLLTFSIESSDFNAVSQKSLFLSSSLIGLLNQQFPPSRLEVAGGSTRVSASNSVSDSHTLVGSSGIGTLGNSSHSITHTIDRDTHRSLSTLPSTLHTPFPQHHSTPDDRGHPSYSHAHPSSGPAHPYPPKVAWSDTRVVAHNDRGVPPAEQGSRPSHTDMASTEVTEATLLRDILFVFQNIDGDIVRFSRRQDAFRIDSKVSVSPCVQDLVHRLCELGWLYRKVCNYVDSKNHEKAAGLVCQSFCSALSLELREYYRLIAVLEAQQAQTSASGGGRGQLSLRRLVVWTHDPLERMKYLAVLVDACKRKKGGELVSTLYSYSHHGNPYIHSLLTSLLTQVYQPLNTILNSWIFDGELIDHFSEFIVSCDLSSKPEKLWRSKYSLRKAMLPSFISQELAKKILVIGKSINFLRQVCRDHTHLWTSSVRSWFTMETGKVTFQSMTGPALQAIVSEAYQKTSLHLLQVLNTKYCFMDHLRAIRKYLLLGQGDLIRHLMDLLAPELNKPAATLFLHNLTGTLETAIRATNAQFEDADILNRLDVQLLEKSPGDQGWDVFSLHYHVDGPISTVFTADNMLKYLQVFNFLWQAKRVQYCLSHMWREQTAHSRELQSIAELHPVLHECHLLISAMVHFVSQLQYYVNFEVMECNWDRLLKKVSVAEDLDHVIIAHDNFLDQITSQCLLDTHSQPLLSLLRTIFDLIISFQEKQESMLSLCLKEVGRRRERERENERRAEQGVWGTSEREEKEEEIQRGQFVDENVFPLVSQFTVLHDSFKEMVVDFMSQLTAHSEQSLCFLCFRLDFNQHYSSRYDALSTTSFIRKIT